MNFNEARERALQIRQLYGKLETKRHGRAWTTEELALGFVGDVGDLAKLILADAGVRAIEGHREKLGHELSDCLWSILVLADRCGINLELEFTKNMDELESHVSGRLST